MIGEAAGPIGHLRPGEPAIAMDQAHLVGPSGGDGLVHLGDRELSGTHAGHRRRGVASGHASGPSP